MPQFRIYYRQKYNYALFDLFDIQEKKKKINKEISKEKKKRETIKNEIGKSTATKSTAHFPPPPTTLLRKADRDFSRSLIQILWNFVPREIIDGFDGRIDRRATETNFWEVAMR